jgi:Zn-dependent metalloprotease
MELATDRRRCCSIAPPDLLARLAREGEAPQREAAIRALAASASMRARRALVGRVMRELDLDVGALAMVPVAAPGRQTVYDLRHGGQAALPGTRIRAEGQPAVGDVAVNHVLDNTATARDFMRAVYGRDSVDGEGLELVSSVHYSTGFDNAFWNGEQMVYGDGSGHLFAVGALTSSLDVIAHELAHGITQLTAGLEYHGQPGALNESFSDVFGSLVKQHSRGETAAEADWLIGEGTLVPALGSALRSLAAPGTAFAGDRQPRHMDDYLELPDDGDPANDNGGVHINSGIPNHAFHLAAVKIGGHAWERAGRIWYLALTEHIGPRAGFADAAQATIAAASELYGAGPEQEHVAAAWEEVGLLS